MWAAPFGTDSMTSISRLDSVEEDAGTAASSPRPLLAGSTLYVRADGDGRKHPRRRAHFYSQLAGERLPEPIPLLHMPCSHI